MPKYSLYYSRYCYFCQKVLMFLRKHQHSVELLSVNQSNNRSALVNGGGKSQVPCLLIAAEDEPDKWLYESDDIIDYLRRTVF